MTRRILVAQAPARGAGDRLLTHVPCRVGVSFWEAARPVMTVVVKATASFAGDGPRRICRWVAPRPLTARSARDGEDRPLPDDFVPSKERTDVLLVGNVPLHARPSGEVPPRHAVVRVGGAVHSFTLANHAPGRLPLRPPYLVSTAGGDPRVGARPTPEHLDVIEHADDFDYAVYQSAHPALRCDDVQTGSTVVLEGLVDDAERLEIELPHLGARVACDWARDDAPTDADMHLDTVIVDLDEQEVVLVWRGFVFTKPTPRHDVDRVIVGFVGDERFVRSDEFESKFTEIFCELPRGTFSNAWELEDVRAGVEPPPLAPEDLEMARYETLDQVRGPSPTLRLDQHARIAAELVEEREPREKVLSRHGFDEFGWALEERALAEQMGSLPLEEGEPPQEAYARQFVAAQDALARPEDDRFSPEDYVAIVVGLEVDDPKRVLRDAGLSLGAWMRIDRRWQTRLAADGALDAKVSALLGAERERRGERPEPTVDDEGRVQA